MFLCLLVTKSTRKQKHQSLLKLLSLRVKNWVRTCHEHTNSRWLHQVFWICDKASLPPFEGCISIEPLRERLASFIHSAKWKSCIGQVVYEITANEDLKQVARVGTLRFWSMIFRRHKTHIFGSCINAA